MTTRKPAKRSKGVTFDDVAAIGTRLPGVETSKSYGTAALKVDGKFMARLKEDGETLVVRMDIVSRDLVLKAQPKIFFITDHYRDYPTVLVRLSEVKRDQLGELLEDAWRLVASKKRIGEREEGEGG